MPNFDSKMNSVGGRSNFCYRVIALRHTDGSFHYIQIKYKEFEMKDACKLKWAVIEGAAIDISTKYAILLLIENRK